MLDSEFYDELEIQDPDEREILLFESLARHLAAVREETPYFQNLLKDINPMEIKGRDDLAALPITRKSDLGDLQKNDPPLAGMTTVAPANYLRLFQSPGPTYEPEADGKDWWRMGRALFAAGMRPGDIVHNTFSYHMTPAGMMIESGARAIGCAVVPAGTGQTEQQIQAIAHIRPSAYAGTPSFLKIILDKAREAGADVGSISKALVSGEALPQALRDEFRDNGIQCLQAYASADLGLIAYESKAMDGLIVDDRIIVEIVRPGTGDPVAQGEIGEVIVTSLNRDYPLIRFATGDLSSVMTGLSPCGRTGMRLTGWKGRADQSTKVRGMFVTPKQIADVLKRHPEIAKARLVVETKDGTDAMTLKAEADIESGGGGEELASALGETLKSLCNLRGDTHIVEPGSLPNDGLVIEDTRGRE
ncbi:MAG: AMP-binding protein [Rhodospirillales bacterium]|nr:AMP-binding protein [Alphaproteobacteria bacterium]MBL6947109.1 AMP-binding protein [Rhodospirillales bacterium]